MLDGRDGPQMAWRIDTWDETNGGGVRTSSLVPSTDLGTLPLDTSRLMFLMILGVGSACGDACGDDVAMVRAGFEPGRTPGAC